MLHELFEQQDVETVLWACLHRLQSYQDGQDRCREYALAITKIEEALHWLDARAREYKK